jgi:hypothetical protein
MLLEARAESCFSPTFVLKLDGRPHGKFSGRWFSEALDVQCTGRQWLVFRNVRWLWSEFVLEDDGGEMVGRATRSGVFTRSWDLELTTGPAVLAAAGIFATGYEVRQDGEVTASVDRVGLCERGWDVRADGGLADTDLILVGLVYHTVIERERRQHAQAGMHGS